jgi:SAM-dependent methyltransferase
MTNEGPIHRAAAEGFARASEAYARGRPNYPREIAGWLRDGLDLRPGTAAVDLGAGTGKFTPLLLETGARVIAVEPVAQMLEKLSSALPEIEAHIGTSESIPLPSGSVDAVVCAQSFHWFATAAALAEIRRVLRQGGRLGMVWNVKDAGVDWVSKLDRILEPYQGDAPRYRSGNWRKVFPAVGFGPLHEVRFPHGHTGPPEVVVLDRVRSTSFIASLAPEQRTRVEDQVRGLIAEVFQGASTVTIPYDTYAYWTEKTG